MTLRIHSFQKGKGKNAWFTKAVHGETAIIQAYNHKKTMKNSYLL